MPHISFIRAGRLGRLRKSPPRGDSARRALVLLLLAAFTGGELRAQAPTADPELAKGKDQIARGDYKEAIATLSKVVRQVRYAPGQDQKAAEAYLQLGIAYAGLGQASPARSQFVQALVRDPKIAPDPKTTPSTALELFDAARKEARGLVTEKKGMSGGTKIALASGVAAAGVGGALAAGSGGAPTEATATTPPYAPIPGAVSPSVQLLSADPPPGGAWLSSSMPVTLLVRLENLGLGAEVPVVFIRAEGVTFERRSCLQGERGPLSASAFRGDYVVSLRTVCAPPFQTDTIVIHVEAPQTGQRFLQSSYFGVYRFFL
jgi:hypothetical protein